MTDNYTKIVKNNLSRLYDHLPGDLENNLPGIRQGDQFIFDAFGEECRIAQNGISLGGTEHASVIAILISLYALNARSDQCVREPFKAFKEFPDSMPYVGAFTSRTEQMLVSHVSKIKAAIQVIVTALNGTKAPGGTGGDFSFIVYPLPKIALCYIFYEADEDFPPSVTCLYSNNARLFLPLDALADVGEYTSRKIIRLISPEK